MPLGDRPIDGGQAQQAGSDLLGGVVSRSAPPRQLAEQPARLTADLRNRQQVFPWLW